MAGFEARIPPTGKEGKVARECHGRNPRGVYAKRNGSFDRSDRILPEEPVNSMG
jgi:hypothetical protein